MNKFNALQRFITVSTSAAAMVAITVSSAVAENTSGVPERFVLHASGQTDDGTQTMNARLSMVRNRPCDDQKASAIDVTAPEYHEELAYADTLSVEIGSDKIILPFPSFTALFDAQTIRIKGDADDFIVTVIGHDRRWSRDFRFVDGWPVGDSGEVPPDGSNEKFRIADRDPAGVAAAHSP